ncbi:MAG: hypothetical protein WA432_03520 [Candidatus Babeliaceae bacterium]
MKQRFFTNHWWLLAVMMISSCRLYGEKNWHNDPAVEDFVSEAPVVNENLDIFGTNGLVGHVHIAAITTDILVTITTNNAIVQSNDPLSPSALHLFADTGHSITFSLLYDLEFSGSHSELLITCSGGGTIIFMIAGDTTLSFSSLPGQEGTIFAVGMDDVFHITDRNVTFQRFPIGALPDSNLNANITVGPLSRMAFVDPGSFDNSDTAIVAFDASNVGRGRLILNLQNDGGVLLGGRYITTLEFPGPDYSDINWGQRAGGRAIFQVINGQIGAGAYCGLLIVNGNEIIPTILANPWCEVGICEDDTCDSESFPGFILDENGRITLSNRSYFDYVGTVTNRTPTPDIPASILDDRTVNSVVKDRNPSALIVDGTQTGTIHAQILMLGDSAMYFRSGVDHDGNVQEFAFDPLVGDVVISFTIDPMEQTRGLIANGDIVLDVEGQLDIVGGDSSSHAINILSWFVTPTGGSVLIDDTNVYFPLRTFQQNALGQYYQYNAACFMVNSRINLYNMNLQHSDEIHQIFEKNFPETHALYYGNFPEESAPTYIGGESWTLCQDRPRPEIAFYSSNFLLHTSAALTGIDLAVPEMEFTSLSGALPLDNIDFFTFYYNGRCIDQGTGRSLVMGSLIGSLASDQNTIVNPDAHLNIFQEHVAVHGLIETLNFSVGANNTKITPGITGSIINQYPVNTFFLGHASNVSIGTLGGIGIDIITGIPFVLTALPTLLIDGDFFSFETQGGTIRQPEAAMVTGEGGIFVDSMGTIEVNDNYRVNMATTVTKSGNGVINLPKTNVFFNLRVGVAQWNLNLSDPTQLIIVPTGTSLSHYTIDWKYITKDFCGTGTGLFIPYDLAMTPLACHAPAVTNQNLSFLPIIQGTVDQLEIRNSRLGDQVNIVFDAAEVREVVFMERADSTSALTGNASSNESGVAPVGNLILQNDALVGLGTAHRNLDSTKAEVMLGINGVTLIANGTAQVVLNEDTLINNVCHILTGTRFGVGGPQTLFITSEVPRELRIKDEAVLDLSQFSNPNQILVIGGQVRLVAEPGSRIILGGGILRFADQAQLLFEPFIEPAFNELVNVTSSNNFRTRISGSGTLLMSEDSTMQIFRGAYVGIETYSTCSNVTSMSLLLQDNAHVLIGDEANFGGSLQIGNTSLHEGAAIYFNIVLNGPGTVFNLNSQGFLGLNAGIVSKPNSSPNNWLINTLYNVSSVTINAIQGTIINNQNLLGSNPLAGLLAIGDGPTYTFNFDTVDSEILGGGNMVRITPNLVTSITPVVMSTAINTATYGASIMASLPILTTNQNIAQPTGVTSQVLFNYLQMLPYTSQFGAKLATVFLSSLGRATIGWINGTTIRRDEVGAIYGANGTPVSPTNSITIGTVGLDINNADDEPVVTEVFVGI